MYGENLSLDGLSDLQDASSQSYAPSQSHAPSQSYMHSQLYDVYMPSTTIHDETFDLSVLYYSWPEGSPPRLRQYGFEGLGQDAFPSTSNQGGDSQLVRISLPLDLFSASEFLVLLCRLYSNTAARNIYMNNVSQPPPSGGFSSIPFVEFRDYFG